MQNDCNYLGGLDGKSEPSEREGERVVGLPIGRDFWVEKLLGEAKLVGAEHVACTSKCEAIGRRLFANLQLKREVADVLS